MAVPASTREPQIWFWALGYFVCYAPYAGLTKLLAQGQLLPASRPVSGFELLPVTTAASFAGMLALFSLLGLWKHAGRRIVLGWSVPFPNPWTLLSGLATAAIIATTTLSYTFSGLSIVFMMLLMRGGVLVIAPLVDALSSRKVRLPSWIALGLSLAALGFSVADGASFALTLVAGIDVAVYVAGYFVRLRCMSHLAKSGDARAGLRYFVEEQMVATPAIVLALVVVALLGRGEAMLAVRAGFTDVGVGTLAAGALVGLLSQGTGVFGALVLLDGRENAFCVPVNRASSVLAGVAASLALHRFAGGAPVPWTELGGAALLLGAIAILALPATPAGASSSGSLRSTP